MEGTSPRDKKELNIDRGEVEDVQWLPMMIFTLPQIVTTVKGLSNQ